MHFPETLCAVFPRCPLEALAGFFWKAPEVGGFEMELHLLARGQQAQSPVGLRVAQVGIAAREVSVIGWSMNIRFEWAGLRLRV